MSVGNDIALGRSGPTERGAYVEAYISRVNPGRFEAALELAATCSTSSRRTVPTRCRLIS